MAGLFVTLLAVGHEFWLQPQRFFAPVGDRVEVETMVGEDFLGERTTANKNKLVQYQHWFNGQSEDMSTNLVSDSYGLARVTLKTPGVHLLALSNTNKFLSMKPDSFALYLREDGLEHIIKLREQQGQSNQPSREVYRRCAKSLLLAGPGARATDTTYVINTQMPLEIIPRQNPYRLRPGDDVDFLVLLNDQPLPGTLVRYWTRNLTNQLQITQQRTDARGLVRFRLRPGRCLVSTVWMVPVSNAAFLDRPEYGPAPDQPAADWQSYWGSLTFGCR